MLPILLWASARSGLSATARRCSTSASSESLLLEAHEAHRVEGFGVVGRQRERALRGRFGLRDELLLEPDQRQIGRRLWRSPDRATRTGQQRARLVEPLDILERERQIVEHAGIVGLERQRLTVGRLGLGGAPHVAQRRAHIVDRLRIGRAQLQRLPIGDQRLVIFLLRTQRVAEIAVGFRIGRRARDRAPIMRDRSSNSSRS